MITGYVLGSEKVLARLKALSPGLRPAIYDAITVLAAQLASSVKTDKLNGQVLNRRTGTLSRSILPSVQDEGTAIVGKVSTNVLYAGIHEYGGDIYPVSAKLLSWIDPATGQRRFAHHVHMPERSFLRSALQEFQPKIRPALEAAVRKVLE